MPFPFRSLTFAATLLFSVALLAPGQAQDRLPALIRANSVVAGQVFGCAARLEVYHSETVRRAAAGGRILPPNYQLNLIAGLDVLAVKSDALQALIAMGGDQIGADQLVSMVTELATLEYDATPAGTPGYTEAWAQASACANVFRQYELYRLYP